MQKLIGLALILSLLFTFSVHAKVQRMGIPKGVYKLAPKQIKQVKAFCLDYDRLAPAAGNVLGQVLSSSSQAVVNLGGEIIPLQKAIVDGMVSINGRNVDIPPLPSFPPLPSANEVLSNLKNKLVRDIDNPQSQIILEELNAMSSSEQYDLAIQLLKRIELDREQEIQKLQTILSEIQTQGDFRHLNFVNNTDKPISIEFRENAVVAESKESIDDSPYDKLTFNPTDSLETQTIMQEKLWLSSQQTRLRDLGLKVENIDGVMDDSTRKAIKSFETNMGLNPTGSWKKR